VQETNSADPVELRSGGYRPELQALRAFAVAAVVIYHFWPARLPGGFVGVDVFFVISGFLITSHLVSAWTTTGRVRLTAFWARRARRLLPASLLVLAVCLVGTLTLVPGTYRLQFLREIVASALYVQNWNLAANSVDYLAAANVASPVQHFWSLSAEEQFYLVWPVLLAIVALVLPRVSLADRRRVLAIVYGALTAASLGYSIYLTSTSPGPAYFVTPTRAWEFGAGGLVAFAAMSLERVSRLFRAVAGWLGWVGIAASALLITPSMPFPGWIALLPVVATVLVIASGRPQFVWSADRVMAIPPAIFLGDISYSVYLWHWPALVFVGLVQVGSLTWLTKLLLLVAVLGLATLTTRYVENPVRQAKPLVSRRARYTLIATAAAMALVAVPAAAAWAQLYQVHDAAVQAASRLAVTPCTGAQVRSPGADCPVPSSVLAPDPSAALDDRPAASKNGCHTSNVGTELPLCTFGDPKGSVHVALIGDSHALNWLPALDRIGTARHWRITLISKAACPYVAAMQYTDDAGIQASCVTWKQKATSALAAMPAFDLVIVALLNGAADFHGTSNTIAGLRAAWDPILRRGTPIIAIHDVPQATATTNACLERNVGNTSACDDPQSKAFVREDILGAAASGQRGVWFVDLTGQFCWDGTCKTAIGGVTVYRDDTHLTQTFSITLAPALDKAMQSLHLPRI
jgi:peptidoglycan/LPS O-acetylase OafA/YrhL